VSRPQLEPVAHPAPFDELRVCLKVSDLDSAVRLYRDGLGMSVVDEWTHPGGQRGVLFGAVYAAVELFDEAQWDLVDESETGARLGRDHGLRLEVSDVDRLRALADRLEAVGATATAEVTRTPWDQTCLRMADANHEQLSLFVLPEEEKRVRADMRARLRP
jgi:catechol 2,3-dioxygenase-like lactoylglutathione lyase family enzyme